MGLQNYNRHRIHKGKWHFFAAFLPKNRLPTDFSSQNEGFSGDRARKSSGIDPPRVKGFEGLR